MNIIDLKESIAKTTEKNIYLLLSYLDVSNSNRFVISAIEESTLIKTNNGWEFEDELKYNLASSLNEEQIELELKKLRKKGVMRGTFIILSPEIINS